jgi:hypothetical protein
LSRLAFLAGLNVITLYRRRVIASTAKICNLFKGNGYD